MVRTTEDAGRSTSYSGRSEMKFIRSVIKELSTWNWWWVLFHLFYYALVFIKGCSDGSE